MSAAERAWSGADAALPVLRLERTTTGATVCAHAARQGARWPAVDVDAPAALLELAVERGAVLLCSRLGRRDAAARDAVLRGLTEPLEATDLMDCWPDPTRATAGLRALSAITAALRPLTCVRVLALAFAANRAAPIAVFEPGRSEARFDARGESPCALALRAGVTVVDRRSGLREAAAPHVEASLLLLDGPGGRWSLALELRADEVASIEATVLRAAVPALLETLPRDSRAPAVDAPAPRPLFRPAALAAWRRRPRATGVPVWSLPLAGLARLAAVAVLAVPLWMLVPVTATTVAPGAVVATRQTQVSAPITGAVARIDVVPGQLVQRGEVLASLGSVDENRIGAALDAYRSAVATALLEPGREASERVARQRRELSASAGAQIRAAVDGRVGDWAVVAGDVVAAHQVIGTLLDPDGGVALEIDLPARHAPQVKPGEELEFTVAGEPGRRFRARITAVAAQARSGVVGAPVRVRAQILGEHAALTPGVSTVAYPRIGRRSLYRALFDET